MKTLFLADWCEAIFVHFRVDAHRLQRIVPFELDRFDSDAYVSLVAFTQKNLRPAFGGRIAALLTAPLATHPFLNLRTYVKHGEDRAIYFLAEWIPNRLATVLGPRTYGLPYRFGELKYERSRRSSRTRDVNVEFHGEIEGAPNRAADGTLQHFLVERYVAFTHRAGKNRRFQIEHDPWRLQTFEIKSLRTELIQTGGEWSDSMQFINAQFSEGAADVRISPPARVRLSAPHNSV